MNIGKDRNKDRWKNDSCAAFEISRFVATERSSSRRIALALPIRVSISSPHLPSLVNRLPTTPRYLKFSNCHSLLALTCSIHCLGFAGRRSNSVLLVLIFILTLTHAAENRSCAFWKLYWEDASSTKLSAKSKQLILQLPTLTVTSTRLWLFIQFLQCRLRKGVVTAHALAESNTNGERWWFNFPEMDTNFWAGIQWLDGK